MVGSDVASIKPKLFNHPNWHEQTEFVFLIRISHVEELLALLGNLKGSLRRTYRCAQRPVKKPEDRSN